MSVPGIDQVGEASLEELVQSVSQQALVLARRELGARARQAGSGAAMVGGGALLGALASGTGTAGLVLLLSRRRGAAASLGVTGAYAGAGALLAHQGLARLREAGPQRPDGPVEDEPVPRAKPRPSSAKRRTASAAKSPRPAKSTAKAASRSTNRVKREAKAAGSARRAAGARTERTRRRASEAS